ncbi:uncharacterized protein LOC117654969 [Pantherophis guttatus]|uniref:Uncharacterized protein LOC117654969 n=1 Tax=Pantherophis guttatus TaxID=94885 RepID=A0A6P9AKP0_PANGU|nr:uncharacterized protein LOC117654969 [Pantherophis guttatus]
MGSSCPKATRKLNALDPKGERVSPFPFEEPSIAGLLLPSPLCQRQPYLLDPPLAYSACPSSNRASALVRLTACGLWLKPESNETRSGGHFAPSSLPDRRTNNDDRYRITRSGPNRDNFTPAGSGLDNTFHPETSGAATQPPSQPPFPKRTGKWRAPRSSAKPRLPSCQTGLRTSPVLKGQGDKKRPLGQPRGTGRFLGAGGFPFMPAAVERQPWRLSRNHSNWEQRSCWRRGGEERSGERSRSLKAGGYFFWLNEIGLCLREKKEKRK